MLDVPALRDRRLVAGGEKQLPGVVGRSVLPISWDQSCRFSISPESDPDPAFHVNPDPDPIRIQGFDDQKLKKKNAAHKFVIFFWIKNYILLIPRSP